MTGDPFTVEGRIDRALASHDPEVTARRVRAMTEERRRFVEQTARGGFLTYEVPLFVADRFPGFDPGDPSTWPEPDRCTEGRPWGTDAYGSVWGSPAERWQAYLTRGGRVACRNRWRDEETRLCGTHLNAYRRVLDESRRRLARYGREEEHRDLAKRLGELHGIEATGSSAGVILTADAARELLERLARGPVPL